MNNWKKAILRQTDTMEMAIHALNTESLRIVIIVDSNERIVGTVTDGDIRRALIDHFKMDAILSNIMSKNPTTALASDSRRKLIRLMKDKDIFQVPIVDKNRKIVGLETLHYLLDNNKFDNPVFLMAGGFGTRLQPLTNDMPKPLLKIGDKPILETILKQFIDVGFHNFYISTHYKADMIREHFGDGKDWDISIKYIHEKIPLGTAGALGLLPLDLPKLPIIMMNGDLLTNVDFSKLLKFHIEQDSIATMCVSEYDFQIPYGVVRASEQKVVSIIEKPVQKVFINAGIYVLNPSLILSVDGQTKIDMPTLLEMKIKDNEEVSIFPIHEYWLDIGQKNQLEQAKLDSEVLFK